MADSDEWPCPDWRSSGAQPVLDELTLPVVLAQLRRAAGAG